MALSIIFIFSQLCFLDRDSGFKVGEHFRPKLWLHVLLENLPHVVRGHIKIALDNRHFCPLFLKFLMILAKLGQGELVPVGRAVLTNLPEGKSSHSIDPDITMNGELDVFTHLNHGFLLWKTVISFFSYIPGTEILVSEL